MAADILEEARQLKTQRVTAERKVELDNAKCTLATAQSEYNESKARFVRAQKIVGTTTATQKKKTQSQNKALQRPNTNDEAKAALAQAAYDAVQAQYSAVAQLEQAKTNKADKELSYKTAKAAFDKAKAHSIKTIQSPRDSLSKSSNASSRMCQSRLEHGP